MTHKDKEIEKKVSLTAAQAQVIKDFHSTTSLTSVALSKWKKLVINSPI